MVKNERWRAVRRLYFILALAISAGCLSDLLHGSRASDPVVEYFGRLMLCVGFVAWGYLYYRVQQKLSKLWLGIIAMAAASVSNWYQIGRLEGHESGLTLDRWLFLTAGVAVMAHGIKQINAAREKRKQAKMVL